MPKTLLRALALAGLLALFPVSGQAEEAYTVIKNGDIPSHVGKGDTFTGTVRREHFFRPTDDAPYGVSLVTFDPGAPTSALPSIRASRRNNWRTLPSS